jgi:aspartate/methionine/tyrosine aminotransferase
VYTCVICLSDKGDPTDTLERYSFLVLELMEVCSRHEVHFIADEVYALSVYDDTNNQFVSVLSLLPQARQRLLIFFSVTN